MILYLKHLICFQELGGKQGLNKAENELRGNRTILIKQLKKGLSSFIVTQLFYKNLVNIMIKKLLAEIKLRLRFFKLNK